MTQKNVHHMTHHHKLITLPMTPKELTSPHDTSPSHLIMDVNFKENDRTRTLIVTHRIHIM